MTDPKTLSMHDPMTNRVLGLCEGVEEFDRNNLAIPRVLMLPTVKIPDLQHDQAQPFNLYDEGRLLYDNCWWATWENAYVMETRIIIEGVVVCYGGKALN